MSKKNRRKVLIVDDEIGIRELLAEILMDEGYTILTAQDAQSADKMRQEECPDLILLDIWMPDMDGISLLRKWVNDGQQSIPVIVMSGHATIDTAVEATRLGAMEVLEKPIATALLLQTVRKGLAEVGRRDTNPILNQTHFGDTSAMTRFKQKLLEVATVSQPVLMVGPIDCGAEFFSRFLVLPKAPVIVVNSGVRLESDLSQLVQQHEDGLIILRAIENYSKKQQLGLLGLLAEATRANTRVVACSSHPPDILLSRNILYNEGVVRALSPRVVTVPSLSEVIADIPVLAKLILQRLSYLLKEDDIVITTAAIDELIRHPYKGGFAELASMLRTAWNYAQPNKIDVTAIKIVLGHLDSLELQPANGIADDIYNMPLRQARECFEREYFIRLINQTDGNVLQAAKIAQLERTYFYRKLKQYQA